MDDLGLGLDESRLLFATQDEFGGKDDCANGVWQDIWEIGVW